jgi:excisionase family DNA binding protein
MSRKRVPLTPERVSMLRNCPCMTISDACKIYNVGKNKIYQLMKIGVLTYAKVGASTLIHVDSLEKPVSPDIIRPLRPGIGREA